MGEQRGSANKEQKGIEKYSPEVRLPSRARTTAARRPTKHSQTRRCAVQQGASKGSQCPTSLCDLRWPEKGTRDQGCARFRPPGTHSSDQRLFPRGDRALLFSRLFRGASAESRELQALVLHANRVITVITTY